MFAGDFRWIHSHLQPARYECERKSSIEALRLHKEQSSTVDARSDTTLPLIRTCEIAIRVHVGSVTKRNATRNQRSVRRLFTKCQANARARRVATARIIKVCDANERTNNNTTRTESSASNGATFLRGLSAVVNAAFAPMTLLKIGREGEGLQASTKKSVE